MKWPKSEEFSDFHTQSFGVNMSFQGAAGALRKNGHPLTPFTVQLPPTARSPCYFGCHPVTSRELAEIFPTVP